MSIQRSELISVRIGANTASKFATCGGGVFSDTQTHSSFVNGSDQTLDSYTIKANSLNSIGDTIYFEVWGTVPSSAPSDTSVLIVITDDNGSTTLLSFFVPNGYDWHVEGTASVDTTGATGSLKYSIRGFNYATGGAALSGTKFKLGSVTTKLTGDVILKLITNTTSSGATPYATEYNMLCQYIPNPQ